MSKGVTNKASHQSVKWILQVKLSAYKLSKIVGNSKGNPWVIQSIGLFPGLLVLLPDDAAYKNHLFGQVHEGILQNHLLKTVNYSAKVEITGTYYFV